MQDLLNIINYLLQRNEYLTNLLLQQGRIIPPEEIEQKIEIPQAMNGLGKMPWRMQKAKLEEFCRKPKLSEVAGIPEENEILYQEQEKGETNDANNAAGPS